jgi:hypothetical protein
MHSYLTQISSATQINDEASRQAFEKRPFSLAIKTPDLINRILGNGGYDLIVDDSAILAETFQETPLRDRAETHFSLKRFFDEHELLYKQILTKNNNV